MNKEQQNEVDKIYEKLRQLKKLDGHATFVDLLNQRLSEVYTKETTSFEVLLSTEIALLWATLDGLIAETNDILKQLKGEKNE